MAQKQYTHSIYTDLRGNPSLGKNHRTSNLYCSLLWNVTENLQQRSSTKSHSPLCTLFNIYIYTQPYKSSNSNNDKTFSAIQGNIYRYTLLGSAP